MRIRYFIISILILALINILFLTGCKPQFLKPSSNLYDEQPSTSASPTLNDYNSQTYTTSFTRNRDSVNFSKIIQAAPSSAYIYNISACDSSNITLNQSGQYFWLESIPVQNGTLKINAAILRPEIDYHSVYLIRDHDFSKSDIYRVVTVLFPNALGTIGSDFSRREIEAELANVKLGQIKEINPLTDQATYQTYNGQEQDIARLQDLLKSMPDDSIASINRNSFSVFGKFKILNSNQSLLYLETSQNEISAKTDRACRILTQTQIDEIDNSYELYRSIITSLPPSPGGSIDQCVEALIASICPAGYVNVNVQRALSVNSETNLIYTAGYYYTFARSIGDATIPPIYTLNTNTLLINDPIYDNQAPTCSYETVSVFADQSGTRYFNWKNSFDPMRIQNQNVQLLSFSDIQSIIRVATVSQASRDSLDVLGKNIEIHNLTLTNTIQQNPENSAYAYIAPAWVVSGTATSDDHSEPVEFAYAISAVDGRFVPLES